MNAADASLVEAFERTWKAAAAREQMLRQQLDARMAEGLRENNTTIECSDARGGAFGQGALHAAGEADRRGRIGGGRSCSDITVVDQARQPVKPVAPDLTLYMAITFFASLWLAVGGAFLMDPLRPAGGRGGGLDFAVAGHRWIGAGADAELDGIAYGVVRLPLERRRDCSRMQGVAGGVESVRRRVLRDRLS